jgi:4a-hydroxytetrahydrobiopterin dehydratase
MPAYTASQAKSRMTSVPLWTRRGKSIRRQYVLPGFPASIAFVRKVAVIAEKRDHHPDIDIRWNKVTLTLSTHSEGGLTAKDFALARLCDALRVR